MTLNKESAQSQNKKAKQESEAAKAAAAAKKHEQLQRPTSGYNGTHKCAYGGQSKRIRRE